MRRRLIPTALLFATGVWTLGGCDQVSSTVLASTAEWVENLFRSKPPAPPFPIKEAKYELIENGNQIYWLDNRRVLFNGADYDELVQRGDGRVVPKSALFIWDTETDRVTRHGDIDGRLCYADGYARYPVRTAGERVTFKTGRFGAEVEQEMIFKSGEPRPEVNRFTCREFRSEDLRPTRENHLIPLRDGDGFLDLGPAQKGKIVQERLEEEPIHLFPEGGKPPIALPMDKREASHSLVSYSAFNDTYLLFSRIPKTGRVGFIANWPRGSGQPLYAMKPNGHTTIIEVPYHESRSGGTINYWLVRPGVFMMSHNLAVDGTGHAGGYLIQDGRFTRLFRGYIVAVGVSPDGCKVAAGIKPGDLQERQRAPGVKIQMIDLCATGAQK